MNVEDNMQSSLEGLTLALTDREIGLDPSEVASSALDWKDFSNSCDKGRPVRDGKLVTGKAGRFCFFGFFWKSSSARNVQTKLSVNNVLRANVLEEGQFNLFLVG